MKQRPGYLVVYKDHRNAQTLYFGPFSDETKSDFFRASLPNPLYDDGGFVATKPVQPYLSFEGHTVAQMIKRMRANGPSSKPCVA